MRIERREVWGTFGPVPVERWVRTRWWEFWLPKPWYAIDGEDTDTSPIREHSPTREVSE